MRIITSFVSPIYPGHGKCVLKVLFPCVADFSPTDERAWAGYLNPCNFIQTDGNLEFAANDVLKLSLRTILLFQFNKAQQSQKNNMMCLM